MASGGNIGSGAAGVSGGRIATFFLGYMLLFVLVLPALILFLYQRQVGSLNDPPPMAAGSYGPEWAIADGHFTEGARLLGAAGPVVDARSIVPDAQAAAAAVIRVVLALPALVVRIGARG